MPFDDGRSLLMNKIRDLPREFTKEREERRLAEEDHERKIHIFASQKTNFDVAKAELLYQSMTSMASLLDDEIEDEVDSL